MERAAKLNWMNDILDHLRHCYDQWTVADETSQHYLSEVMKRDLDEFRRLCDASRVAERGSAVRAA
jgi:hypothetical protein